MRRFVIAGSLILFVFATMSGSWITPVTGAGDSPDSWGLLPFRNALPLGMRSFAFSLPVLLLCLLLQHKIWSTPLTATSVLGNVSILLMLGLLLGRINLAMS